MDATLAPSPSIDTVPVHPARPRPVASWTHTAVLAGITLALAAGGAAARGGTPGKPPNPVTLYSTLIVAEWVLVWYVAKGLRRTGTTLRVLIGGRWPGAREVVRDIALGLAVWALWLAVDAVWVRVFGAVRARAVGAMRPRGVGAATLWVALSVSAGVAEEVVFRG